MKALIERMNALCDALPFQTSWYLHDLTSGERADRLGDTPVPSASTRKISILSGAQGRPRRQARPRPEGDDRFPLSGQ